MAHVKLEVHVVFEFDFLVYHGIHWIQICLRKQVQRRGNGFCVVYHWESLLELYQSNKYKMCITFVMKSSKLGGKSSMNC